MVFWLDCTITTRIKNGFLAVVTGSLLGKMTLARGHNLYHIGVFRRSEH